MLPFFTNSKFLVIAVKLTSIYSSCFFIYLPATFNADVCAI